MKVFSTLLFMSLALVTQAQQAFSLEEAITYAMVNAAEIKLEKQNIADAEGQILEYKSIGIPKLYLNAAYTYYPGIPVVPVPDFVTPATYQILKEEGLVDPNTEIPPPEILPSRFGTDQVVDVGVQFNSLLFDFSWVQGLKAQEMYRELVVRELDVTEYQVRANISRAYMAVLISQRSVELIENNISNIDKLLKETQALYDNGFAEQLDVDRLELSKSNLDVELEKLKRQIDVSMNILKFQMGYPVKEDIVLTDDFEILTDQLVVESVDLTSEIDYASRPEYRALTLSEDLTELNQKVIKAGYMPSFSVSGGYNQTLQRNRLFDENTPGWFSSSFIGVNMSVPIFDGLERKAKLDRAKVQAEQATLQRETFENSMHLEVYNARIQYVNARQTVLARRDAMDLAQSIYNTTQIKYREGVGSSVEQTQAESELYTAQTNFINSLYDLLVAKTDLEVALGKM